MKIVTKSIWDLDSFIKYLESHNYSVEEGAHAVLLDHSEVLEIYVRRSNELSAIFIAHYITPYYRVELEDISSDDEYLKRLIEVKHSGAKWRIPVNPLIGVVLDDDVIKLVEDYRDSYPISDGEKLVEHYRSRNPSYNNIPQVVVARLLEKLGFSK